MRKSNDSAARVVREVFAPQCARCNGPVEMVETYEDLDGLAIVAKCHRRREQRRVPSQVMVSAIGRTSARGALVATVRAVVSSPWFDVEHGPEMRLVMGMA